VLPGGPTRQDAPHGCGAGMSMLGLEFMRNAFMAGGCIALAAGLVGYFVVLRNQVFTADALGHVAFTGGLGGVLAGLHLLAGAVAESVQAVGALLIFGLMVTPAAVAQNLSTRPWVGMALSAGIAVAVVWLGLVVAFYIALPASFLITGLAFVLYLASHLARR